MKRIILLITTALCLPISSYAQGSVPVRIDDPVESHCIDAKTETVTIHVRRVFTQKKDDLFTEDKRAGVVLTARVIGDQETADVKIPSVSLITIKEEKSGQVSLALEYKVASMPLKSTDGIITSDIQLSLYAVKKRGKNTFGQILDIAGQALTKLPIPANPYSAAASKFLEFTNDAVNASIAEQQSLPFGEVSLSFNLGQEPNLKKCKSAGKERTGAFAVLLSTGLKNAELIPTTNTENLYCFTYNSNATYELLAAKRVNGLCPSDVSAYKGVNNDYTMFLMSARTNKNLSLMNKPDKGLEESRKRCKIYALPPEACGLGSSTPEQTPRGRRSSNRKR